MTYFRIEIRDKPYGPTSDLRHVKASFVMQAEDYDAAITVAQRAYPKDDVDVTEIW